MGVGVGIGGCWGGCGGVGGNGGREMSRRGRERERGF
jgi:hypothetical protein